MDFLAILKYETTKGPLKAQAKLLPPAATTPPVSDNGYLGDGSEDDNENLLKRRQATAVYQQAQEGTVAGFPSPPPNY